jgi:hypothetical protein
MRNPHPTPLALQRVFTVEGGSDESVWRCGELCMYGEGEHYNWGFRIYRTVYTPGSDRGKLQASLDSPLSLAMAQRR